VGVVGVRRTRYVGELDGIRSRSAGASVGAVGWWWRVGGRARMMAQEEGEGSPEESAAEVSQEVPSDPVADASEESNVEVAEEGDVKKTARRRMQLADIVVNEEYEGTVKTITSYGAFVDIGSVTDGLLHVSQLADRFVESVADIVNQGDKIKVRVLSVDPKKREISLTMRSEKKEQESGRKEKKEKMPWADFSFDPEVFVPGKVVSTTEYGAFINVGGPTDGMVHISEMSDERTEKVSDAMKVGDEVSVRITGVDPGRNRISLSMKTYTKPAEGQANQEQGSSSYEEDLKVAEEAQPKFKTSFELAFERAYARQKQ